MKRVVRKPTRNELPFIRQLAVKRGMDIYRDEWPAVQYLADDGLIELSPPRGPGMAWKRASLPRDADW